MAKKWQPLEISRQLADGVCVAVRDADSDSGNCQEDCCVQGEAEASQSFITLGRFQASLLVSVPVVRAVSQPVILFWEI